MNDIATPPPFSLDYNRKVLRSWLDLEVAHLKNVALLLDLKEVKWDELGKKTMWY